MQSKVQALAGIVQHFPVPGAQQVLDSASHMGINAVVQHDDLIERVLSLNGSTKFLKGPTTLLCVESDIRALEC